MKKKENFFFLHSSKYFFVPRSLRTTRKNRTSPNTGTIKQLFSQNLTFKHN
jgi:hypothetical protein